MPVTASFQDRVSAWEEEFLAPEATRSYPARRQIEEADSPLRTPFQRDRDRIVHSKAFRRLKHKTQVFIAPKGDHYRTRLTHTMEVTQVARTIANSPLVKTAVHGADPNWGRIVAAAGRAGDRLLTRCARK